MHKQIAALLITLAASNVNAEEICVVPVVGGLPKLPVEFEQPYRIATSPRIVPGFDGLIVKASNRHELYEFNGSSLTLIEDDFPHVSGFAFEHGIHLGPDGDAFGFGSRPQAIFRFGSNGLVWEPIEATRGYDQAFFDQGTGDAYWHTRSSTQLKRIRADGAVEDVDLPVFNGVQTVSLRTIPEINGALSLTGHRSNTARQSNSIWFRPLSGEWVRVPLELPDGQRLLHTLQDAEIQISNGFVRIFPSNTAFAPLIFRFSEYGLDFVASLPTGTWKYHTASQNWIGRIGPRSQSTKTGFGFWKETPETLPPHFLVLGQDEMEARPIPGLASQSNVAGETIFYHPRPITIIGEIPAFVHAEEGIVVLDGVPLSQIQVLSYEDIGNHPTIKTLGGLNIIQSEIGVFILNYDLSLDQVDDFPAESPWLHEVSIEYVDAWQSYIVIDRQSGDVHQSKDMRLFTKVETEKRVNGVVGVLPNPASVLLVGEEQLLVATKVCPS